MNPLIDRLYSISKKSLGEANRGNPFISKKAAFVDLNRSRATILRMRGAK
jgi:hypothetical protein